QAEEQVQVLARTQNPAIELLVEEGDHVEKDQVLLRLESDRQKTAYDQTMTQFDKARVEFERLEKLYKESLISESEYLNAKFAYDQARLQLDTAKRDLDYTEVRAPIQGTITARSVKVGDKVTTGTSIFEIINLESTVAVVHAPEQYLPKLKKDMQARLISATLDNQVFEGYVKRISPVVDAEAGTVKVVVGVKERGSLSPGMWVQVELVLDENDEAILIPKRSITYAVDQTFAFKVDTDEEGVRRAKRQLVVVRNSDKEHIEPVEGFEEGDLIVVAGQGGLKDDSAIRELSELESVQDPVGSGNVADTSSPAVETPQKTKPGK
ncbi:efflux RND transporter periplasmic adaptor subunit, partial [Verrucomicrobia bacterium]|nr:efflux RND transporter periplasmic adaptor subunit [Verrucomicrobiota bacterium]